MSRADRFLREAVEAIHRGRAAASLERLRAPELDRVPASAALAERVLSSEGKEALAEVRERAELPPHEIEHLAKQVDALRYAIAIERAERAARGRLHDTATEGGGQLILGDEIARIALTEDTRHRAESARLLDAVLHPLALERMAAHERIEASLYVDRPRAAPEPSAAGEAPKPASSSLIVSLFDTDALAPAPRDLPQAPWLEHAQRYLDRTDAAADDAVRFLVRGKHRGGNAVSWHTLIAGLRAPELDSEIGRKQRWSRASAWWRRIGFEEDMNARLHAEVDHATHLPFATLVPLEVPRDVRIAMSPRNFGVLSDLCAADGVGRALALALTHAALPSELRFPIGAGASGVLGTLAQLAWCDREHLTRIEGLTQLQAERIARLCGTFVLLWSRLSASLALTEAQGMTGAAASVARLESLAHAAGRALCTDAAPGLLGVIAPDRMSARARVLESLMGLAAGAALRERFDRDWFRNPRTEGALRAVAGRGNLISAEAAAVDLAQAAEGAAGIAPPVLAEARAALFADAAARAIELVS